MVSDLQQLSLYSSSARNQVSLQPGQPRQLHLWQLQQRLRLQQVAMTKPLGNTTSSSSSRCQQAAMQQLCPRPRTRSLV
jgi:hypothetical protein